MSRGVGGDETRRSVGWPRSSVERRSEYRRTAIGARKGGDEGAYEGLPRRGVEMQSLE